MSGRTSETRREIDPEPSPPYLAELKSVLTRNDRQQDRLDEIDVRISIAGTRGKSTLTRWLHDELVDREFDTYAKITGREPLSIYNGFEWIVPRGERVTLYENELEIRRFFPMDAIVIENQGITPYTTRLVNTRYVRPTLMIVPNLREDHLDTLGDDRERIVRALARSVPADTHVICGAQASTVRDYFARELRQRDARVTFVDVPPEFVAVPGAELVYCLDEALRAVDGRGLDRSRAEEYLESFRVEWRRLPGGRVHDAASVNDVQSTEVIRRALVADDELIQPLIYLRWDRPGRTASYARYVDELADRGLIEQVRVINGHKRAFDARTSVPVLAHDPSESAASVLTTALEDDWPVLIMGNANPPFMEELREVIDERARTLPGGQDVRPLANASLTDVAGNGAQILLMDRAPPGSPTDVCPDLLTPPVADHALLVTFSGAVDDHLDDWAARPVAETPDHMGVIAVGETARGAATTGVPSAPVPGVGSVGPIVALEDVTELGTALPDVLDDLAAPGSSVSVCLDSITDLLEDQSLEDTFRIVHLIGRQLASAGVTAHYHLSAEDQQGITGATLRPLFDSVITVNEDGDRWIHD